jgi:hypothetical protein
MSLPRPMAREKIQIFKGKQLTIGLDLGDRTSHYCVLNEMGGVIVEDKLATTPKGMEEVFQNRLRSHMASILLGSTIIICGSAKPSDYRHFLRSLRRRGFPGPRVAERYHDDL